MAAVIARRMFEENPQAVFKAFVDKLTSKKKRDVKAFEIFANRAYGKVDGDEQRDGPTVIIINPNVSGD